MLFYSQLISSLSYIVHTTPSPVSDSLKSGFKYVFSVACCVMISNIFFVRINFLSASILPSLDIIPCILKNDDQPSISPGVPSRCGELYGDRIFPAGKETEAKVTTPVGHKGRHPQRHTSPSLSDVLTRNYVFIYRTDEN